MPIAARFRGNAYKAFLKEWGVFLWKNACTGWKSRLLSTIEESCRRMKTKSLFGTKIGDTRVVPLTLKIVAVFIVLIVVSNFATNYVNLTLNRGELVRLMNDLLVKELKELYTFSSNQYDIYEFSGDLDATRQSLVSKAEHELKRERSLAMAVKPDGSLFFVAGHLAGAERFPDQAAFDALESARANGVTEGPLFFNLGDYEYFGIYKYNDKWDAYLMRAEERNEFYDRTSVIFFQVAGLIVFLSIIFLLVGVFVLRYTLRFVPKITEALMRMQSEQKMGLIDLSSAPNDDVTYLGASFNALSASIDNLMTIFRTFVTQDVVKKAYQEREIRLEGSQKDLTILFSDIKGFTYMTETLGNEIIALLNLHYDQAIRRIHEREGIVGSIIGDALLAVYGTLDSAGKSMNALLSAYEVQQVAASLRDAMRKISEKLIEEHGALTPSEQKVFRAVLLEVGVGIDGGEVFYGNIGSRERMTNTVIGDNVNSASRLEGLTRIYRLPIICSEYVVNEVLNESDRFVFVEIDTVQVKGKTQGKKVFYPLDKKAATIEEIEKFSRYGRALQAYYEGRWAEAREDFAACGLPAATVFLVRMEGREPPAAWSGVWALESK